MKSRSALFMLLVVATAMLVLAACGGAAATESPALYFEEPAATEAPAMPDVFSAQEPFTKNGEGDAVPQDQAAIAPMSTAAAYEIAGPSGDLTVIERSNRMIVKNADV